MRKTCRLSVWELTKRKMLRMKTLSQAATSRMLQSSIRSLLTKMKFLSLTTSKRCKKVSLLLNLPTTTTQSLWIQCTLTWCQRKTRSRILCAPTSSSPRQTHKAQTSSISHLPSTKTAVNSLLETLNCLWKTLQTWSLITSKSREAITEKTRKQSWTESFSFMEPAIVREPTA